MDRKTLVTCISVLAGLAVLVTVAVIFLYSGTGKDPVSSLSSEERTGLYSAVPSDAVLVAGFSDMKTACSYLADTSGCMHYFSGEGKLVSFLSRIADSGMSPVRSSRAVISLHYNGALVPLLAVDAGHPGARKTEELSALVAEAVSSGLKADIFECSDVPDGSMYLSGRTVLLVSPSEVIVKSSERHMEKGISILDSDGFAESAETVQSDNVVFVRCRDIGKLFTGVADRKLYGYADFFKRFASWTAFSVSDNSSTSLRLTGRPVSERGQEDFVNTFKGYSPSRSRVTEVLPSYTVFFASLPVSDVSSFISASDAFYDGMGRLDKIQSLRKRLQKEAGISPEEWAQGLSLEEVAFAAFEAGGKMDNVLLLKAGKKDSRIIPAELLPGKGKDSSPQVIPYPYRGFASSVFGSFFSLADEAYCTFIDGWLIVGSQAVVSEYAEGKVLENTLSGHAGSAGLQSRLSSKDLYFTAYFSVSESSQVNGGSFRPYYAASLGRLSEGYSYIPAIFSISRAKDGIVSELTVDRIRVMKMKAPVFERDTVVVIPSGPFPVKNSGTGKMNSFYQQDNMYLCLNDENGKGLWGVPFKTPLCGAAGTVDYFANGKLQILFASGSRLYLIDRLGRYVSPFPVDLGKEILIGPGIYDFNGTRKYNVMILHKDNTIEMYNLQGKRPSQWKTISPEEKIKGLPEAVKAGGRTYWVVRTSIQTLIYGFYGGEPLVAGEGDRMIRSDSQVIPGDGASLKAVCYDGKTHVFRLDR